VHTDAAERQVVPVNDTKVGPAHPFDL
jgi:hypothetical protein